jgi:hypothetical protein
MKTHHNRGVRRRNKVAVHKDHESYDYLPSGGGYKKAYCPWDICDWKWIFHSEHEVREHLEKDYASKRYFYFMK